MKKLITTALILLSLSPSRGADNNSRAIESLKAGRYDVAKSLFIGQPDSPERDYYLAQSYYALDQRDSAAYYYDRCLTLEPNYLLAKIGRTQLEPNPNDAVEKINDLLKEGDRKDPTLWIAAANAVWKITADSTKTAPFITQARKLEPQNPDCYILEGDIAATHKLKGKAGELYQQAIYFDPKCSYAMVKYADLYAHINPKIAIEAIEHLLTIDPQSMIAVRTLAELYYQNNQIGKALQMYQQYIESPYATFADRGRYAAIIFFAGDFSRSLTMTQNLLQLHPDDFRLQRLLMYNLFELKDFDAATAVANQFMALNSSEHIANDYLYYGEILTQGQSYDKAVQALQQALNMDSTLVESLRDLAALSFKQGDYAEAVKYYDKFIERGATKVQTKDYFALGRANYLLATALDTTNVKRADYAHAALGLFERVCAATANSYLGYFWAARASSLLDPESTLALAKPYYEKAMTLLTDGSHNAELIECYSYLGYYYFLKQEVAQSRDFWNKILALDPSNETALKALAGLK